MDGSSFQHPLDALNGWCKRVRSLPKWRRKPYWTQAELEAVIYAHHELDMSVTDICRHLGCVTWQVVGKRLDAAGALRRIVRRGRPDAAQIRDRIMREVPEKHNVSWEQIRGDSRVRSIVAARHEAAYRLYHEACLSNGRTGQILGGMDHSSIIHAVRRHAKRLLQSDTNHER